MPIHKAVEGQSDYVWNLENKKDLIILESGPIVLKCLMFPCHS